MVPRSLWSFWSWKQLHSFSGTYQFLQVHKVVSFKIMYPILITFQGWTPMIYCITLVTIYIAAGIFWSSRMRTYEMPAITWNISHYLLLVPYAASHTYNQHKLEWSNLHHASLSPQQTRHDKGNIEPWLYSLFTNSVLVLCFQISKVV